MKYWRFEPNGLRKDALTYSDTFMIDRVGRNLNFSAFETEEIPDFDYTVFWAGEEFPVHLDETRSRQKLERAREERRSQGLVRPWEIPTDADTP